jgi:lipoprotein-anchoring transpeptidase ErfK/SrfK
MYAGILAMLLLLPGSLHLDREDEPLVDFLMEYLSIKYNHIEFDRFIYVAAKRQRLYLIEDGEVLARYSISTAKNGMGTKEGSYQTPPGWHQIAEKVGEGLPVASVIKQKQPTGTAATIVEEPRFTGNDLITSRILHLRGLEENLNTGEGVDSYSRGIFIHGTHEEGLIGRAASKGCIRMKNTDIIELFEKVEVGTFVVILNN